MKDKTIDDEPIIMSNYCIKEIKKISYIPGRPQVLEKEIDFFTIGNSLIVPKNQLKISILTSQFYNFIKFPFLVLNTCLGGAASKCWLCQHADLL